MRVISIILSLIIFIENIEKLKASLEGTNFKAHCSQYSDSDCLECEYNYYNYKGSCYKSCINGLIADNKDYKCKEVKENPLPLVFKSKSSCNEQCGNELKDCSCNIDCIYNGSCCLDIHLCLNSKNYINKYHSSNDDSNAKLNQQDLKEYHDDNLSNNDNILYINYNSNNTDIEDIDNDFSYNTIVNSTITNSKNGEDCNSKGIENKSTFEANQTNKTGVEYIIENDILIKKHENFINNSTNTTIYNSSNITNGDHTSNKVYDQTKNILDKYQALYLNLLNNSNCNKNKEDQDFSSKDQINYNNGFNNESDDKLSSLDNSRENKMNNDNDIANNKTDASNSLNNTKDFLEKSNNSKNNITETENEEEDELNNINNDIYNQTNSDNHENYTSDNDKNETKIESKTDVYNNNNANNNNSNNTNTNGESSQKFNNTDNKTESETVNTKHTDSNTNSNIDNNNATDVNDKESDKIKNITHTNTNNNTTKDNNSIKKNNTLSNNNNTIDNETTLNEEANNNTKGILNNTSSHLNTNKSGLEDNKAKISDNNGINHTTVNDQNTTLSSKNLTPNNNTNTKNNTNTNDTDSVEMNLKNEKELKNMTDSNNITEVSGNYTSSGSNNTDDNINNINNNNTTNNKNNNDNNNSNTSTNNNTEDNKFNIKNDTSDKSTEIKNETNYISEQIKEDKENKEKDENKEDKVIKVIKEDKSDLDEGTKNNDKTEAKESEIINKDITGKNNTNTTEFTQDNAIIDDEVLNKTNDNENKGNLKEDSNVSNNNINATNTTNIADTTDTTNTSVSVNETSQEDEENENKNVNKDPTKEILENSSNKTTNNNETTTKNNNTNINSKQDYISNNNSISTDNSNLTDKQENKADTTNTVNTKDNTNTTSENNNTLDTNEQELEQEEVKNITIPTNIPPVVIKILTPEEQEKKEEKQKEALKIIEKLNKGTTLSAAETKAKLQNTTIVKDKVYFKQMETICDKDYLCNSCSSEGCTDCTHNSFYNNLTGYCNCDEGYFQNSETQSCELCSPLCASCITSDYDMCLSCKENAILDITICLCLDSFIYDKIQRKCVDPKDLIKLNYTVLECPEGEVFSSVLKSCIKEGDKSLVFSLIYYHSAPTTPISLKNNKDILGYKWDKNLEAGDPNAYGIRQDYLYGIWLKKKYIDFYEIINDNNKENSIYSEGINRKDVSISANAVSAAFYPSLKSFAKKKSIDNYIFKNSCENQDKRYKYKRMTNFNNLKYFKLFLRTVSIDLLRLNKYMIPPILNNWIEPSDTLLEFSKNSDFNSYIPHNSHITEFSTIYGIGSFYSCEGANSNFKYNANSWLGKNSENMYDLMSSFFQNTNIVEKWKLEDKEDLESMFNITESYFANKLRSNDIELLKLSNSEEKQLMDYKNYYYENFMFSDYYDNYVSRAIMSKRLNRTIDILQNTLSKQSEVLKKAVLNYIHTGQINQEDLVDYKKIHLIFEENEIFYAILLYYKSLINNVTPISDSFVNLRRREENTISSNSASNNAEDSTADDSLKSGETVVSNNKENTENNNNSSNKEKENSKSKINLNLPITSSSVQIELHKKYKADVESIIINSSTNYVDEYISILKMRSNYMNNNNVNDNSNTNSNTISSRRLKEVDNSLKQKISILKRLYSYNKQNNQLYKNYSNKRKTELGNRSKYVNSLPTLYNITEFSDPNNYIIKVYYDQNLLFETSLLSFIEKLKQYEFIVISDIETYCTEKEFNILLVYAVIITIIVGVEVGLLFKYMFLGK